MHVHSIGEGGPLVLGRRVDVRLMAPRTDRRARRVQHDLSAERSRRVQGDQHVRGASPHDAEPVVDVVEQTRRGPGIGRPRRSRPELPRPEQSAGGSARDVQVLVQTQVLHAVHVRLTGELEDRGTPRHATARRRRGDRRRASGEGERPDVRTGPLPVPWPGPGPRVLGEEDAKGLALNRSVPHPVPGRVRWGDERCRRGRRPAVDRRDEPVPALHHDVVVDQGGVARPARVGADRTEEGVGEAPRRLAVRERHGIRAVRPGPVIGSGVVVPVRSARAPHLGPIIRRRGSRDARRSSTRCRGA